MSRADEMTVFLRDRIGQKWAEVLLLRLAAADDPEAEIDAFFEEVRRTWERLRPTLEALLPDSPEETS